MATFRGVPLSVLDLAPVVEGTEPPEALTSTLELARTVEQLGYARYWLAEHHNMPGIASSAPQVLIAAVAAATRTMRIGSGGVMLPNHAPLVVAEQFGTLEALYPGRIDLGIGRAPGTDPVTAQALRRTSDPLSVDDFPQQLAELRAFFSGRWPDGHAYRAITATPAQGLAPPVWLLGSSGYSAQVAGLLGLRFAFAHHFSAANTEPALELYRSTFRPSDQLPEPHAMVAVGVVVADDDQRAAWLAKSYLVSMLRIRSGERPERYPTPDRAASVGFTQAQMAALAQFSAGQIVGGPETVQRELDALLDRTAADELMITTTVSPFEDRVRSYELLAKLRP